MLVSILHTDNGSFSWNWSFLIGWNTWSEVLCRSTR
jgi:hypothetical protein